MRVLWLRRILQIVLLILGIFTGSIFLVSFVYDCKTPSPLNDTTPPVILLNGGEEITIPVGDEYIDEGVDAYDLYSDITVSIDGNVDYTKPGTYDIKYTVSDETGNTSETTRTVNVIKPSGTVYLTFDDGPSDYTPKLLDVLKKYGVKATFFVTGNGDDSLIKREFDEGHAIGLHTLSHNYSYIYQNTDNFFSDLDAVSNRVKSLTGLDSKLMRFPGGSSNLVSTRYDGRKHIMSALVGMVSDRGYTYFDWNVDSNDAGGASTSDEVFNNVTSRLKTGEESVVLQHDVKEFSVDAVERIIQFCNENGFVFKKLDEQSFNAHHGVNN